MFPSQVFQPVAIKVFVEQDSRLIGPGPSNDARQGFAAFKPDKNMPPGPQDSLPDAKTAAFARNVDDHDIAVLAGRRSASRKAGDAQTLGAAIVPEFVRHLSLRRCRRLSADHESKANVPGSPGQNQRTRGPPKGSGGGGRRWPRGNWA